MAEIMTEIDVVAKQTIVEIENVIQGARKGTDQKIHFIVSLLYDDGKKHTCQVRLDVGTDHHFCDQLTGIMETWWDYNHKVQSATIQSSTTS